jgi:hypothetical protein
MHFHNSGMQKYPFSRTSSSVGLNYTPYMGKLTNDVFLLYGAFHNFGQEERSTISASIYYFNMGEVDLTQLVGNEVTSMGYQNQTNSPLT